MKSGNRYRTKITHHIFLMNNNRIKNDQYQGDPISMSQFIEIHHALKSALSHSHVPHDVLPPDLHELISALPQLKNNLLFLLSYPLPRKDKVTKVNTETFISSMLSRISSVSSSIPYFIALGGYTRSGKSKFAEYLMKVLQKNGTSTIKVGMDNFIAEDSKRYKQGGIADASGFSWSPDHLMWEDIDRVIVGIQQRKKSFLMPINDKSKRIKSTINVCLDVDVIIGEGVYFLMPELKFLDMAQLKLFFNPPADTQQDLYTILNNVVINNFNRANPRVGKALVEFVLDIIYDCALRVGPTISHAQYVICREQSQARNSYIINRAS